MPKREVTPLRHLKTKNYGTREFQCLLLLVGLARFIDLGSLSGGFKLSQAVYIKIVGGFKSTHTNNKEENKK